MTPMPKESQYPSQKQHQQNVVKRVDYFVSKVGSSNELMGS
jgi:hypothetical protein